MNIWNLTRNSNVYFFFEMIIIFFAFFFQTKDTLWEGGVRGSAMIWSPLLQYTSRVSDQLMTIIDWLPTLFAAAGADRTFFILVLSFFYLFNLELLLRPSIKLLHLTI